MAGDLFSIETLTYEQVAKTIDHSLLRPELDTEAVRAGCEIARVYDVASACVKPCDVVLARELLAGSDVKVGTVIAFPHGASTTVVKAFEAEQAIAEGAEEPCGKPITVLTFTSEPASSSAASPTSHGLTQAEATSKRRASSQPARTASVSSSGRSSEWSIVLATCS